jgi:predicted PhzF superfamily epimerase YddE/YHI9
MTIEYTHVDAFTSEAFRGNPATVVLLESFPAESWMLSVAAELEHAATAFLVRRDDGFAIRWFTPVRELALCGHGTLASARTLWEHGHVPADQPIAFHFASGRLDARRTDSWIELDFPSTPPVPVETPPGMTEALGATPTWVARNRLDLLAVLEDETAVRALTPDVVAMKRLDTRGVIVTAPADAGSGFDFVSRFFAPGLGLNEDSVTGSAHCCLGPYWAERLGRDGLVGYQASARGGVVRTRVAGDRVFLSGQTRLMGRGSLFVDPLR